MIARAQRLKLPLSLHLLVICAVLAPRYIASPPDAEALAKHKPAHSSGSASTVSSTVIEDAGSEDGKELAHMIEADAAESLTSSSNVGAEATRATLSDSAPSQCSTTGVRPSADTPGLPEAAEELHASSMASKTPGLPSEVASTLLGHVVNVSQQADQDSSSNQQPAVQAGLPAEGKREQPSQAQTPPKKPEVDEERHNFALAKDGAKVVGANKEARKPESVLDSDGDTFLKNECKADKWLIIELSQVTKIDMLRLSQDELYSSRIRDFAVFGRQSHPRAEGPDYGSHLNASSWQLLGRFTAANTKGTQAFNVEPPGWAKYVQLHLLTHYGSEPVCALNDVGVYGKSAAEDLEDRLAMEAAADDEAAAQEECSPEDGDAQLREEESQPQASGEGTQRGKHPQDGKPDAAKPLEGSGSQQKEKTVRADDATQVEQHQIKPQSSVSASEKAQQSDRMALVSPNSDVVPTSSQSLPASGGSKAAVPPVLDILGEGLMRLIVPPGAGKKRSAYSGKPTDPQALPQPDAPSTKADVDMPEKTAGVPAKDSVDQAQTVSASVDGVKDGISQSTATKLATESATPGEPGSKTHEEASIGNGGKKQQKDDRSVERDGDLLLAGSSAGSARSRHGGSVYDLLVAEIKALKLQQKTTPKVMGDMQRNVTLAIAAIASEVSALHRRVSEIEDSSAIPSATCAAALPDSSDGQIRVYPNSTAEHDAQSTLAHAEGRSGPVTINFDAMALALELAALRTANERASRRELALVMVVVMLCATFALSLPQLAVQNARLRSVILLLAVANGFFGVLLHFSNTLQPEKSMFTHVHRLLAV